MTYSVIVHYTMYNIYNIAILNVILVICICKLNITTRDYPHKKHRYSMTNGILYF